MQFTAEQWALLARRLEEGLDLPPAAQPAWVASLQLDDALKTALLQMLARDSDLEESALLRTLPELTETAPTGAGCAAVAAGEGLAVGPYRLVRELGRGGMGAVWLADRVDGALTRRVALKLPHAVHDAHFLERFRRERDILASFAHPNIAQIYDAGVTSEGRPFIALEYVEGACLTQYCDAHRLTVRQRLELFLQVIAAVQYAHSRLVIHRDIKPGNILVGENGTVKLLDFGIAKLISAGESEEPELTQVGAHVLTLDYAAPEQILGKPVGTASDVYSLGVVLCELLAGVRPYSLKRSLAFDPEAAILGLQTARPSQLARDEARALARRATPAKLAAGLRGDLDTIVLKCLKIDPAERYASADAFAQDIQRYLHAEPVLARPESALYRARKFVSRHRIPVVAAAAMVVALAAGLGAALWQARVASREARTARAVESFLEDIFRANSADQPDPAKARLTTARQLLDIGARKIEGELNQAPEARLRVLDTLANMYVDLGVDDRAVALNRERLVLARSVHGSRSPEFAEALVALGASLHSSSFVNERHAILNQATNVLDRLGDSTSRTRGHLLRLLAEEYQSTDPAKAVEFARQSVAFYRRNPSPTGLVEALYMEGMIRNNRAEWKLALPLFSEAIALSRKTEGDPNASLTRLYSNQGSANEGLVQLHAAERSYRNAYAVSYQLNGEDHVDTVQAGFRLGIFLTNISHTQEGLRYLDNARKTVLKIRGPADPFHTPQVLLEYGVALGRAGRIEEGLGYIAQAVANRRKNRPGTLYLASMLEAQASLATELGTFAEAQALLDEASAIRGKVNDRSDRLNISTRVKLLLAAGKSQDAARFIETAYATWPATEELSTNYLRMMRDKAAVAVACGDAQSAIALASRVRQRIAASSERPYLKVWDASFALSEGQAFGLLQRPKDALPLLTTAVGLRSEFLDPQSPTLAEALVALSHCQFQLGNRDKAGQLRHRAQVILSAHPRLGDQYRAPLRRLD